MKVAVVGLWHLGCVTAACLAGGGHDVVGVDFDEATIAGLRQGRAPVSEPGLDDLIAATTGAGRLVFAGDAAALCVLAVVVRHVMVERTAATAAPEYEDA